MMSMQRSTHSLQMNTAGPAISLTTSCWLLPPKEQERVWFEWSFVISGLYLGPCEQPELHHDSMRRSGVGYPRLSTMYGASPTVNSSEVDFPFRRFQPVAVLHDLTSPAPESRQRQHDA